jgi:phosphate transport system substrate-binding protein
VKKLLALLAASIFAVTVQATELTGAGATFPFPIYAQWAVEYQKSHRC